VIWLLVIDAWSAPVTWDTVVDAADAAWDAAEGASMDARIDGAERSARVAPELPSITSGGRLGSATNQELVTTLAVPLALGTRSRRRWHSAAETLRREDAHGRQVFVEEVLDAWVAWWTAEELVEHLDEWSADVERTLAPLDDAVSAGVAAPLDAEDLRAELASVRAEAAGVQAEAVRAAATLTMLLGEATVLDRGDRHLHDLDVSSLHDPWSALTDQAASAPAVRASEARAAEALAHARASRAWRPQAEVGVAWADGNGPFESLVVFGLSAPLRAPGAAEARAARGEALAASKQTGWLQARVQRAWEAESVGFGAALARIERLDREVIGPLERRLDRLDEAFRDGLVPADRVVRARRDHHESEHERLVLTAGLLGSIARADALRRVLEVP